MTKDAREPGRAATDRFSAQLPRANWIGQEMMKMLCIKKRCCVLKDVVYEMLCIT